MKVSCASMIVAVSAVVAVAAAGTCLGVVAQALVASGQAASQWWEIVVISCSAVSAVCGLAVLAFQLARASRDVGAHGSPLGLLALLASLAGAAAHVGMLTCYTIFLATYDPDYNAFDYFGSWQTRWQVMYIFGVCVGALAWLVALVAGVVDMRLAQRRHNGGAATRMDEFIVGEGFNGPEGTKPYCPV